MDLNLKNKKALITGASRGIGYAIKRSLEDEGVECISWSRSEGVDLTKNIPEVPEVNFIIHNVGGGGTWKREDYDLVMRKNYNTMVDIELKAPRKTLERVIAIASIYGKEAGPNEGFTAAKSAMIAYIKSCARKYGVKNLTYNVVCPGYIRTKESIEEYGKKINAPIGSVKDIANIVTFLCSDKASFINGACIIVDGGFTHSY